VQLSFANYWRTDLNDTTSGWSGKPAYNFSFSPTNLFDGGITGYRKPAEYEFRFSSSVIDTSLENSDFFPSAAPTPVKFRIYNRTDSTYVKCLYYDLSRIGNGALANNVQVVFVEKNPFGRYTPTWTSYFTAVDTAHFFVPLTAGDTLRLRTVRPFRSGDVFTLAPTLPKVDAPHAAADLSRVKAVPNPYVTAAAFEPPLNPGITSGRGQRKIEFIHLPAGATVRVYTSRGDHIATLHHDGNIEDGTVSWDLRTFENLDVAFGVYFYVVESSVGTATGKLAIIK
jgi:hypothetical protein